VAANNDANVYVCLSQGQPIACKYFNTSKELSPHRAAPAHADVTHGWRLPENSGMRLAVMN
jgi:hypothetical protein